MKIVYKRSYKKLNKQNQPIVVFVYEVSGTEDMLLKYKELSGDHYRVSEEGVPVYFSTRFVGESGRLLITKNDKIVVDTSEFDKAMSIVQQYGGDLGAAMANMFAGKLIGTMPVVPVSTTADEPIDSLG